MEEPVTDTTTLGNMNVGEAGSTQTCGNNSYNYGMGRFFQRSGGAFDCMQGTTGMGMGATPYSYPSYHTDWGLMPGPYAHGFNLNRPLGINNLNTSSSGFLNNLNNFSVHNSVNSRDYGPTFSGIGRSSSAFTSAGLSSHNSGSNTLGNMCGSESYRGQCASPESNSPSSPGNSSPCLTNMEHIDKIDNKNKGKKLLENAVASYLKI